MPLAFPSAPIRPRRPGQAFELLSSVTLEPSPSFPRTKVIYRPAGRAGEYAEWACNLYTGCPHGCLYCYAPAVTHQTRAQFADYKVRDHIIEHLAADAKKLQGKIQRVHLCFTCDPYPPLEQTAEITRAAIQVLHKFDIGVQILTKNPGLAMRDLSELNNVRDRFGCTLTFVRELDSRKWEPHASNPDLRMIALRRARELEIPTWASIEPVIDVDQVSALIAFTHKAVDHYFVGPINHFPELREKVDWPKFARDVTAQFKKYGSHYELKADLKALL